MLTIRQLEPRDLMHRRLLTTSIAQFERLMQTRWRIVEETGSSISVPFYVVLVFWLAIVFGGLGLTAPRNALSYTTIALGGLSIVSAIFVILELDSSAKSVLRSTLWPRLSCSAMSLPGRRGALGDRLPTIPRAARRPPRSGELIDRIAARAPVRKLLFLRSTWAPATAPANRSALSGHTFA